MPKKDDEQIRHEAVSELAWDTRTWNQPIEVEVKDRKVTLLGTVASCAQMIAAQDAMHHISGVLGVDNKLKIEIPRRLGGSDLAQAARRTLERAK